ncbi:MAG: LuxR C-terminal-related transcriptional regulator [Salibacteraceae bacterium]
MEQISLILADAHLVVREGMKSLLADREDLKVVGEAASSDNLEQLMTEHRPQIVVMDYDLRGYFDVSDVKRVKEINPNTEILIITSNLSKDNLHRVMGYGANGFLLKECDREEIIGAIYAMANREKFFCQKVLDILMEKDTEGGHNCVPTKLSKREMEVVKLVAEGHTTQKIADQLCLSIHTVNTHRKNIMRKLEVKTAAELVIYAVNMGIVQLET